jgi:hypothetical protein
MRLTGIDKEEYLATRGQLHELEEEEFERLFNLIVYERARRSMRDSIDFGDYSASFKISGSALAHRDKEGEMVVENIYWTDCVVTTQKGIL